ncbi:MAG: hypothetical protein II997_03705 [Clostridia bacterium]|nr:hypothetical protein [Clostridia bacterium]
MKKSIFLVIVIVLFLLAIAGFFYHKTLVANEDNPIAQKQEALVDESEQNDDFVEISVDSVKGITKEEAEKLCYSVLGEKDAETGFIFSFGVSGAVEKNEKQYYTIRASWLVNNSHMSYIGDFFVSADGKELYNGLVQPGEYEMLNRIWSE